MSKKKKLLIVTGLSGSGKHQVLYQLEDLGYFCMDNLPAPLLLQAIGLLQTADRRMARLAVGVDVRSRIFLEDLKKAIPVLRKKKIALEILFLEASSVELMRRFSETRRPHPLQGKKTLLEGIRAERLQLAWLRESADFILDTTRLSPVELKQKLTAWLDQGQSPMHLTISSFGYKYGIPGDADLVFDMRFLPNPFYIPALKKLDGTHVRVQQYVLQKASAQETLTRITQWVVDLLPEYVREGKTMLHVALGCTGGQHRSVVMANELGKRISGQILIYHRELQRKNGVRNAKAGN